MSEMALFDMEGAAPGPGEKLSADRRRTIRQQQALENGRHPVGLCFGFVLRLHPDAPPVADKSAPGPRCGSCRFRESFGAHSFPKCMRGENAPYATHSASSDVRAWWPACDRYEPAETEVTP